VLVPAVEPHVHAFFTEGEAVAVAHDRLAEALDRFAAAGLEATGSVGDAYPVHAVADLLRREPFDEVIVSTLPPGLSRWIHQDLPRRIERHVDLPVRHVVTPFEDLRPGSGRQPENAGIRPSTAPSPGALSTTRSGPWQQPQRHPSRSASSSGSSSSSR
jgi:hypothetical protein